MRRYYLSIRALHPETLVNPFPKKCVVVAQRLSTFDNDIISYIQYKCEPKLANGAFLGSFFVFLYLILFKKGLTHCINPI